MAIVFMAYLENDRTCVEQATIVLQSAGHEVWHDRLQVNLDCNPQEIWDEIRSHTEARLAEVSDRSYLVLCLPDSNWPNWMNWKHLVSMANTLEQKNIVVVPALLLEAQDHRWIQDLLDIIQLNESTYHFGNWLRSQQISEEALMGQWKKMRQQQQKIFVEI